MILPDVLRLAISPALALLPRNLDTPKARVLLLGIGLQESRFEYRRQLGNGPARSFWQFERGTQASRGGVWGVWLHRASSGLLRELCRDRDCNFDPAAIWAQIERDDVLAAGVARLLLLTNPAPLPDLGDQDAAWLYYVGTWRPGKPHPETWAGFYARAAEQVSPA